MTAPADEPELRIVERKASLPKLLTTAVTEADATKAESIPIPPYAARARPGMMIFVGTALLAGLTAAGANYWFRHESPVPARPISVLKPIRQALPTPPSPPLEVHPNSLHVNAIVLGHVPLAVVNGKQLAEGDWLELRTAEGVAALRVVKIEDGAVHFGYGGHIIYAKFEAETAAASH